MLSRVFVARGIRYLTSSSSYCLHYPCNSNRVSQYRCVSAVKDSIRLFSSETGIFVIFNDESIGQEETVTTSPEGNNGMIK